MTAFGSAFYAVYRLSELLHVGIEFRSEASVDELIGATTWYCLF